MQGTDTRHFGSGRMTRALPVPVRAARPLLAWAIATVSLVMAVSVVPVAWWSGQLGRLYAPSVIVAVAFAVIGGLLAARRPGHVVGWLMLFVAFTQGLTEASGAYIHTPIEAHIAGYQTLPGWDIATWVDTWMWMPGLGVLATFMLLLFPSGRLPSPRWRWLAWLEGLAIATAALSNAIASWPRRGLGLVDATGPPAGSVSEAVFQVSVLILLPCMLASIASLFVRYRGAAEDVRRQLRWIIFATILLAAGIVSGFDPVPVPGAVKTLVPIIGVVAFPVAVAVSILRYRLYDIDVVISRTLVYGSLAVFITAVYVGIAVGIGAAVGAGGKPNLGLSILATAIVAVGFQPVRERVQHVANKLVYGERATPYEVLSQFSERLSESYAADEVMPRMARVLAEGTGAQRADVWLHLGDSWRPGAVWPEGAAVPEAVVAESGSLP